MRFSLPGLDTFYPPQIVKITFIANTNDERDQLDQNVQNSNDISFYYITK